MGTIRRKPSILLTQTWDGDEQFSTEVDLGHCNRAELLEVLRGKLDESTLATATHKTLLGAARQKNLERRLRGSEALMYRANVIMQYLARLEHTHNCKEALKNVKVTRRNQWAIVSKVPASSVVKVGSVIAAIDGQSTLFAPFEQTQRLLHEATHGDERSVTFRWAPFHQGWVEIDSEDGTGVYYLILAYGYAAYFDQQQTPRKRIGSVSLTGATLTPISSPRGSALELNDGKSNRILLRPPPTSCDKWKPIIPIVDLAAVFVVAVAHANGADDVRALEMCRVVSRAPSATNLQETIAHSMSILPCSVPEGDFTDKLPNFCAGVQACTDRQWDANADKMPLDTQHLKHVQSTHIGPYWTTRLPVSWPFSMSVLSACREPPPQEDGSSESAETVNPEALEYDIERQHSPSMRAQHDTKSEADNSKDTSAVNTHARKSKEQAGERPYNQHIIGLTALFKRKSTVLCKEAYGTKSSDLLRGQENWESPSKSKSATIDRPPGDFRRVNLVQNDVIANASQAHRRNATADTKKEEHLNLVARESEGSVYENVEKDNDAACTTVGGVPVVHKAHRCLTRRPRIQCKLVNGLQPILYIDVEHLLQCRKSAETPWSTLKLMLCCEAENNPTSYLGPKCAPWTDLKPDTFARTATTATYAA